MKIKANLTLVMFSLLALAPGGFSQERPPAIPASAEAARPAKSIEGTTWAGTDSDGDFYEYTFLPGGRLRYKTNTEREELVTFEDKEDIWAQNGPIVIILIQKFSSQIGFLRGDRISGQAWNVKERRWTWEVKEKSGPGK